MKTQPKVLLVEDDPYTAEGIITVFKMAGMAPIVTSSISEAKRAITKHHPDVVVMDIGILPKPGEDVVASHGGHRAGLVLADWIATRHPKTAMIGYSGAANPEFKEQFEGYGGRFLVKLAGNNELVRTVYELTPKVKRPVARVSKKSALSTKNNHPANVFIIHGHDDRATWELKNYIQNTLGLPQPIILHEQPNLGRTIIEKLQDEAEEVGIAFVLLTPDDLIAKPRQNNEQKRRARQNVIFEMGFFFGLLGRRTGRVILLHKGRIELPSDIHGLVYIDVSNGIEAAGENIRRELRGLI